MKKTKRLLPLILTVTMVATLFVGLANFASAAEAVEIPTVEKLHEEIVKQVDGDFILTGDIEIDANDWTPIEEFKGNLDGGGHTVTWTGTGSYSAAEKDSNFGIFAVNSGTIKNLNIAGELYVEPKASDAGDASIDCVSALAGINRGLIENVNSSASIGADSSYNVGGIAGINEAVYDEAGKAKADTGIIKNSSNSGEITGTKKVGGLTGVNTGTVKSSFNTGVIDSNTSEEKLGLGGIAGYNGNKAKEAAELKAGIIMSCYNTGEIYVWGCKWLGGISGFQNAVSSTDNCYDIGEVTGESYSNPITGNNENLELKDVANYTNQSSTKYGTKLETGMILSDDTMKSEKFAATLNKKVPGAWKAIKNDYPQLTMVEEKYSDVWDGKTVTEPEQDDEGYYVINNAEELMWWNQNPDQYSKVRLNADIRLNEEGKEYTNYWTPVGAGREEERFEGEFDGQGHSISGLCINIENTLSYEMGNSGAIENVNRMDSVGMFAHTYNAKISNLGLNGSIYVMDRPPAEQADWLNVGGIVGFAEAETVMEKCYTNLSIVTDFSTDKRTQAGISTAGHPEKCDVFVGGIAGVLYGEYSWMEGGDVLPNIKNCYSRGEYIVVNGRVTNVGGIAGGSRHKNSYISNSYSSAGIQIKDLGVGKEKAESYLGGIIGNPSFMAGENESSACHIENCLALNPYLIGDGEKIAVYCGAVIGKDTVENPVNCSSLKSMKIADVIHDGMDGTVADEPSYEILSEGSDAWEINTILPQLKGISGQNISARKTVYKEQVYPSDSEWDGYFANEQLPPYLNIWYAVDGHERRLAHKFTSDELRTMAEKYKDKPLEYTTGSGDRINTEAYIPLTDLFDAAKVRFIKGDNMYISTPKKNYSYEINEPWLMEAERFSYNSEGEAVPVMPVFSLVSQSRFYTGENDHRVHGLLMGQQTPDDMETFSILFGDAYNKGLYEITDITISYKPAEKSNYTLNNALIKEILRTEKDPLAASGEFAAAREAARQAYIGYSTNEDSVQAIENLERAEYAAHGAGKRR